MFRSAKRFLILSLLLNCVLSGTLLGHLAGFGQKTFFERMDEKIAGLADGLPDGKREQVAAFFNQAILNNRETRNLMRELRAASIDVLRTDPFDPELYAQKSEEVATMRAQTTRHMVEATLASAELLTAEERRVLADRLEAMWQHQKR